MQAGDTFLMGSIDGDAKHLHIILGFFDTHYPIVINTTTPENIPGQETFFLTSDDHDWLTKPRSILAYHECKTIKGHAELQKAIDTGAFVIAQHPIASDLLKEIVRQTIRHPDTPRLEKKRLEAYYADEDWL